MRNSSYFHSKIFTTLLLLLITATLCGCASGRGGLNSAAKTNQLVPGMSTSDVKNILGEPSSSQFTQGILVWKYYLQKPWVGWIPYYLAFHNDDLIAWQENVDEYYANQELWIQTLPQKYDINLTGNVQQTHYVSGNINLNHR